MCFKQALPDCRFFLVGFTMAKIVSPVWSSIRGSIAGITYFTTPAGQIIARQRTVPVNPQTNRQNQIRASFAISVLDWKELLPAERDAWHWFAQNSPVMGPQGNYFIDGRQMFMRCIGTARYLKLRDAYPPVIDFHAPDIPGNLELGGVYDAPLDAPGTGRKIIVTTPTGENQQVYLFYSRPFHPSRNYFTGPYRTETLYPLTAQGVSSVAYQLTGLVENAKYSCVVRSLEEDGDPSKIRLSQQLHHVFKSTTVV